MEKILITGVSGFIGSHLAKELSEKGFEVYGIVKFSTSRNTLALYPFLKDTVILTCDISDTQSVANTLKSVDPDVIVHLAALSPVRDSFEKPLSYVKTNVEGTLNIAHSMLDMPDFDKRKLIYASTAEVYGIQKASPIKEDAPLNPSSPYSTTKAMTDQYLRMMANVYGLNTTIMRCTNTYGRKLDTSFYIEYLITTMLKKEKVYIGAPDSIRDYMYVTDHINAYVKAIEHSNIKGEAFNASVMDGISNKDVAYKIAEWLEYDEKNIILGKYPPNYPLRPLISDQPFILLDNNKIKDKFDWEPLVPFEKGINTTINYWKEKIK